MKKDRTDYPDTPDGQLAFELNEHNKKQQEEIDYFNNIDTIEPINEDNEYPLIED